jgi:hypothetical protein
MQRAGMSSIPPIKQAKIMTTISNPKNRTGRNEEKSKAAKPMMTEKALKTIPRPVV